MFYYLVVRLESINRNLALYVRTPFGSGSIVTVIYMTDVKKMCRIEKSNSSNAIPSWKEIHCLVLRRYIFSKFNSSLFHNNQITAKMFLNVEGRVIRDSVWLGGWYMAVRRWYACAQRVCIDLCNAILVSNKLNFQETLPLFKKSFNRNYTYQLAINILSFVFILKNFVSIMLMNKVSSWVIRGLVDVCWLKWTIQKCIRSSNIPCYI